MSDSDTRSMRSPAPAGLSKELAWLEPPVGERAIEWARAATSASTVALTSLPSYGAILAELKRINTSVGHVADVALAGALAVRFHKTADRPKGLLQTAPRSDNSIGEWRTVLDIAELSKAEGKDFELRWDPAGCLPPRCERCVLSLHELGGDEAELREFDLGEARFVPMGFSLPRSRAMAAWIDADTWLVGHTLGNMPRTITGLPARAMVWRRGESIDAMTTLLELDPAHAQFLPIPAGADGQALIAELIDYSTIRFHRVMADGTVTVLSMPTAVRLTFTASAEWLFVQLAEPASLAGATVAADSVVAVPLNPPADLDSLPFEVVYAARAGEVVDSLGNFQITRDAVALPIRRGLALRLDTARRDAGAWLVEPLIEPEVGFRPAVTGGDPNGSTFVVNRSSFLTPPMLSLVAHGHARRRDGGVGLGTEPSRFTMHVHQAKSIDGTLIEFYLVAPRIRTPGSTPTLMTGYGAFGLSMCPAHFSTPMGQLFGGTSIKVWMERGGALVVPAIRGGGERGAAWHQAAMREKRQTSYDDFHAVAESLIASGFTAPRRLGVFGLSNGGLLAAVAGTQRPDLYGAIVCDVPLADMLRFPEMGMGAAWIDEYGDPKDPLASASLIRYSPLHNLQPDLRYPPFLVTVATSDNRVGPGHARKLARRLMDIGAQVHYLESEDGGHGVSDSLLRPELMAMRTAFLIETLMGSDTSAQRSAGSAR